MSADLHQRLDDAAGHPDRGPDVPGAIARGDRLRRRRRVGIGAAGLTTVAIVAVAIGAQAPRPSEQVEVPPIGQVPEGSVPLEERLDPLGSELELFAGPLTPDRELRSWSVGGGPGRPGVGLERPAERLRDPGYDHEADGAGSHRDVDPRRARLATKVDELEVYLIPTSSDPYLADGREADGDWLYAHATAPGWDFWGSAPVPDAGEANWAGSFLYGVGDDMELVGLVIVGDGLDTVVTEDGAMPVEGNVAVIERFGYESTATFTGPAGEFVLTTGPDPGS